MENLANKINSLESYYEMNDSRNNRYFKNASLEKEIATEILANGKYGTELQNELEAFLTNVGKTNFDRYFSNIGKKVEELPKETKTISLGQTTKIITPIKDKSKSNLFKFAWKAFKSKTVSTFSEALKLAWKKLKFIKNRTSEVVYKGINYYIKPDWTIDIGDYLKVKTVTNQMILIPVQDI